LSFVELWRRNDIFALLILALALLVPLSMASPFGASGASRYLDEAALLLIWGFSLFIALGTGARLFPPEFESRTALPLFSRPLPRGRILLGKYLGGVLASWSALLFFYALFAASVALRGGAAATAAMLQAVFLHLLFAAVAVALALLMSLVLSRGASLAFSGTLLAGMFFFGRDLPRYAEGAAAPVGWILRVIYAVAPHAEFFDMRQRLVHGWDAVDAAVVAVVAGYALVYAVVLLLLAKWTLERRRV
jgi:hypothetical protein